MVGMRVRSNGDIGALSPLVGERWREGIALAASTAASASNVGRFASLATPLPTLSHMGRGLK